MYFFNPLLEWWVAKARALTHTCDVRSHVCEKSCVWSVCVSLFSTGHTHTRATTHFHYFTVQMLHFDIEKLGNWVFFNHFVNKNQKFWKKMKRIWEKKIVIEKFKIVIPLKCGCGCGVRPLYNQGACDQKNCRNSPIGKKTFCHEIPCILRIRELSWGVSAKVKTNTSILMMTASSILTQFRVPK